MPEFVVRFFDASAQKEVERTIQAPDRRAIAAALGIPAAHVLVVAEKKAAAPSATQFRRYAEREFSQELAVLMRAGLSLVDALQTLREKEAGPAQQRVLDALIDGLRKGESLSKALGAVSPAFSDMLCALIEANERTGQLPDALAQHARYLTWTEALHARLMAALVYPGMLLAVGGAVILFLLLYVLPRFAGILDGLNQELPWASVLLIKLGQSVADAPRTAWAVAAAALVASVFLVRAPFVQRALRSWIWKLPYLGPKLRVIGLARLYRSLSMLLMAGVPALQALRIVRGVVPSAWRPAIDAAGYRVERGERLSDALELEGLATPVARRMLRVGERSGELAGLLEQAAAFHDEEVARLADLMTRAINPALMLVMGVLIGGIVLLMYLPIFELVEQVQ